MSAGRKVRIGIWLPLGPGSGIRGEGLLRLLALISCGLDPTRHHFVFYCPIWLRRDLEEEIKDYPPVQREMFSIQSCWTAFSVVTLAVYYSKVYTKLRGDAESRGRLHLSKRLARIGKRLSIRARRLLLSCLRGPVFAALAAGVFLVIGGVGWQVATWLPSWGPFVADKALAWFTQFSVQLQNRVEAATLAALAVMLLATVIGARMALRTAGLRAFFSRWLYWRPDVLAREWLKRLGGARDQFYQVYQAHEYREMARLANRTAKVDVWLTVHPQFDSARHLKKPVVSFFADFVFLNCPSGFDGTMLRRLKLKAQRLVVRADALIVFSEHVRDQQLLPHFKAASEKRVHLIPHAMIDYSLDCPELTELTGPAAGSCDQRDRGEFDALVIREFVARRGAQLRRRLLAQHPDVQVLDYVSELPFGDIPYVFCSTQNRPYKNILTLVKAIRLLVREHYRDLKLIMTGGMNFEDTSDLLAQYVRSEQLHWDVISIPRVPRLVHAALFRNAALTVHPSFFEGGFPFTFGESVSLGTPVLLARAPYTLERYPRDAVEPFLFDPYSDTDLADKIDWALANREELLTKQRSLFETASSDRSWKEVGAEYAGVFEQVLGGLPSHGSRGRERNSAKPSPGFHGESVPSGARGVRSASVAPQAEH